PQHGDAGTTTWRAVADAQSPLAGFEQCSHLSTPRCGQRADIVILEVVRHQVPPRAVVLDDEASRRFAPGAAGGNHRVVWGMAQWFLGRVEYVFRHIASPPGWPAIGRTCSRDSTRF